VICDERRVPAGPPRRLEHFAREHLGWLSRQAVRRLILEGVVRVNGRRAKKGDTVVPGDAVTLPAVTSLAPQPDLPVRLVFEDPYLVAVSKPGGMPSHAREPTQRDTVAGWLCAHFPETMASGEPFASGLAHRLDTGTSGLLLAARSPAVFAALRAAFRERRIEKRYLAVVSGTVPPALELNSALAHLPGDQRRDRSWQAHTSVRLVRAGSTSSVVGVTMSTGVTHQIRVHLAAAGHPIIGDRLYGGTADPSLSPGRHALHAAELSLVHPVTGVAQSITSPPPDDLSAWLADG
jgi:23S rRNA pseudouridine1911/1915/1917 synthase